MSPEETLMKALAKLRTVRRVTVTFDPDYDRGGKFSAAVYPTTHDAIDAANAELVAVGKEVSTKEIFDAQRQKMESPFATARGNTILEALASLKEKLK